MNKDCIFCKIVAGEIPSQKVFEDDKMIIINDISPQAKCHYLLIPKDHYANIVDMTNKQANTLGQCLKTLSTLTDKLGLASGFRIISNKGEDACQSVEHLHIHIMGGEKLTEKMG